MDQLALFVDQQAAVGVAVERDADLGSAAAHGALQRLGVRGAALAIDIVAIGLGRGTELAERQSRIVTWSEVAFMSPSTRSASTASPAASRVAC